MRGGAVIVSGATSSQFLSGLLLCAPLCDDGVTLEVADTLVSRPYIDLTIGVMARCGAGCRACGEGCGVGGWGGGDGGGGGVGGDA